jgi:hypothetical protein
LSEELFDKLEYPQDSLSLNKLKAYTEKIGLNAYVENVCKEINSRIKEKASQEVFMQLSELNEELKQKDVTITQREEE